MGHRYTKKDLKKTRLRKLLYDLSGCIKYVTAPDRIGSYEEAQFDRRKARRILKKFGVR